MYSIEKVQQLHTHHDKYGVHKCLGVLALGHFTIRFSGTGSLWVCRVCASEQEPWKSMRVHILRTRNPTAALITTGSMGFQAGDPGTLAGIIVHTLLANSAFIFHTPIKRIAVKPMMWREFQVTTVKVMPSIWICHMLHNHMPFATANICFFCRCCGFHLHSVCHLFQNRLKHTVTHCNAA